jgi:hypothetical protein
MTAVVDERHAAFGLQDRVAERRARPGLSGCEREHDDGDDRGPRDSQRAVLRVVPNGEHVYGLHGDVDGEEHEGDADESQRSALAVLTASG